MTTTTDPAVREMPAPPARAQAGYLRRIFKDPQPVLDELSERYGPMCALGFGPVRMAMVADPTALRDLFAMPTENFVWGHKFNVLGFVVGSESMIVSDGPDHTRRRASVQGGFSRRRLNGWIPMIIDRTDAAIDRLERSLDGADTSVDMYPVGRSLVLEIVVRAFFGERMSARSEEIGDLFQRPQDYLESPLFRQLPHPFPFTKRARVRADRQAIDAIINEEISHRRLHPTGDPLDVLEVLVEGETLSDSEIRDQVDTLIGAGYDTTSASLAWMFIRAALTPGLWERLGEEAALVLGPVGQTEMADHTTLSRLDLANRTMRETLRLHPAGVVSPREAAVDVIVGGYRIPKGTLILWSPYLAGRNATAWPDPLRFDPDRFLTIDSGQQALADMSWVPFGRGARNCIGFALAQMELTLILARMAQRLELRSVSPSVPGPVGMVVNRPIGGAPMHVRPRPTPPTVPDSISS